MSGLVGGIGEKIGNKLGPLFDLPDLPTNPTARKAARIAFDLIIVGLGIIMLGAVTSHSSFCSGLLNPSYGTYMILPFPCIIMGLGLSWLLDDLIAKKHKRTFTKAIAYALPVLVLGGALGLAGSGFVSGFNASGVNLYFLSSFMLAPTSLVALHHAKKFYDEPLIFDRSEKNPIDDSEESQYSKKLAVKEEIKRREKKLEKELELKKVDSHKKD